MGLIPPGHDAAAVWIGEFESNSKSVTRAFSSGARAKRWIESQANQSLEWEQEQDGEWRAATEYVVCRVTRVTLHDPVNLRRRFPAAFNGDYTE